MYQGDNPAALRSQEILASGLMELLQTESFSNITVKSLCAYTGISRQTFYNAFDSLEDAIRFKLFDLCHRFVDALGTRDHITFEQLAEVSLLFSERNKSLASMLLRNNLDGLILESMQETMDDFLSHYRSDTDVLLDEPARAFFVGGLCAMVLHRFEYPDDLSASERAHAFAQLVTIPSFTRLS